MKRIAALAIAAAGLTFVAISPAADAPHTPATMPSAPLPAAAVSGTYKVDPVHSSVVFKAKHANAGYVWGRFKDISGTFVLDAADPTKDGFSIDIPVASIDTNNDKRDAHLKSPDFFNAKQYPDITFKSRSVTHGAGRMIRATGELQVHGVSREVTLQVTEVGAGDFPAGTHRVGLDVEFGVTLSEFQIKGLPGVVDDTIRIIVDVEGVKQ